MVVLMTTEFGHNNGDCNAVIDGDKNRKLFVSTISDIDMVIETNALQGPRNEFPAWKVIFDLLPNSNENNQFDDGLTPVQIMEQSHKLGYIFNRNMVAMGLRRLQNMGKTVIAIPSPAHAYRKSFMKMEMPA
jgi:hypothetical protein